MTLSAASRICASSIFLGDTTAFLAVPVWLMSASSPALSSALPISAMSSLILAMSPALLVRAFLAAGDGPSFVRLDELAGATAPC